MLYIEEGQNITCNMQSCIVFLEDNIWQASKTGLTTGCKMLEMYLLVFKLQLSQTRDVYIMCQWLFKHHTRCRTPMTISNANRWQAFSSEPPDTYTAIRILHAELKLVWKYNIVQLLYPTLLFSVLESPSLPMLHCQGKLQ